MNKQELEKLLEAYDEAVSGERETYKVTDEVELAEDAVLWLFESGNGRVKASAVSHSDGTVFVMSDWQEPSRPETSEDVENYDWRRSDGKLAIVLSGLPRCLE